MFVETGHTIIGTAGHIDHGKTALVKALTGIDVDTLSEEKRRGITIELGFAFLDTPELEKEIIFIDVPGHEKLVKTMVAGASNIDAALLVIAADDGINVQTLEHFDILQLLGIPDGVIALTKADIVDDERIREVTADIQSLVGKTFLDGAPIIPVSALTGTGVDKLKSALVDVSKKTKNRRDNGIFRMPIDRAFTMHGFGTVIAGTILSGKVNVGDKLEILPDGLVTRVRGIQVHANSVQQSCIGVRTAINLHDIKKDQLRRGQCACAPGTMTATNRIDAQFNLLLSYGEELKNRTRIRFHVGADEVIGRLLLLDQNKMSPGQSAAVQIVLESPTVALPKDRFVIRAFSSMKTIGGGVVLDAHAKAHKRYDESTVETLEKLKGGADDIVEQAFVKSGVVPLAVAEAANVIGESENEVTETVRSLLEAGKLIKISGSANSKYISAEICNELIEKLKAILEDYYSRNPYRTFMPVSDLQSRFCKLASRQVYDTIIADLAQKGIIRASKIKIGLADRQVQWKPGERELAERIEKMFIADGYTTRPEDEVQEVLGVSNETFNNIMTALIDSRRIIRLGERVTYPHERLKLAKDFVISYISEHGSITAAEMRDNLGVTRKYTIAILEYLDNLQVTKRLGDKRVLK